MSLSIQMRIQHVGPQNRSTLQAGSRVWVEARVSMRVMQVNVDIDTKTSDDVTVNISLAIQYKVRDAQGAKDAYYTFSNLKAQMRAYVEDSVRSCVPKMTVDEMFANRDVIAKEVYDDLTPAFTEYGLDIVATLVTDMRMDRKVEVAMNTRFQPAACRTSNAPAVK